MKLINKDALIAEIKKTYKFHEKRGNEHDSSICDVLYGLSHRIDLLEVKEMDLEKEYEKYYEKERYIQTFKLAKHFFELGLKAQKGELI
jgi:hypothetical protein